MGNWRNGVDRHALILNVLGAWLLEMRKLFQMYWKAIAAIVLLRALCPIGLAQPRAADSLRWREQLRLKLANVGDSNQLFVDDLLFDNFKGITWCVHPPRKTGETILARDKPWEDADLNWFNVMKDGETYRMWYECNDVKGWDSGDDTSFCYAESGDGLHWKKPDLGLFDYHGIKGTNILFRLIGSVGSRSRVHGVGIFKDPQAPPECRYKAVSQGLFRGAPSPFYRIAGMTSPDGLHWVRLAAPICNVFADSQDSCFWDVSLQKYILYGRLHGRGRAIGRSASSDFAHFDPLDLVLDTDDRDPPNADLYNPAAIKYPYASNVYLMFPSFYEHGRDVLDIRLAVSRDGIHWTRPEQGLAFVPLGSKGEFDSGSLYMGQGMIRVKDELWQYYSGSPLRHESGGKLENLKRAATGRRYSRAVSRVDGFVSVDAGGNVGSFMTIPLIYSGNALKLNFEVRPGGVVRVALLDGAGRPVLGRSLDDCIPLVGNQLDARVNWKNGADVAERSSKPTRLQVKFKNASIYGFQFCDLNAGSVRSR